MFDPPRRGIQWPEKGRLTFPSSPWLPKKEYNFNRKRNHDRNGLETVSIILDLQ